MARVLVVLILIVVATTASSADTERELCTATAKYHGAAIDVDVRDADLHDVLRMLADAGHVNLAIASDVTGKVTLRLKRVAWDQAACAVAGLTRLSITIDGNVLLVRKAK